MLPSATNAAIAAVHLELKHRVGTLATIASIAPLLGLLIATEGIVESFAGCGGERSFCMSLLADRLANSLTRATVGLFVGILALVCYRILCAKLENLHLEMKNVVLELANTLLLARQNRIARVEDTPQSGGAS